MGGLPSSPHISDFQEISSQHCQQFVSLYIPRACNCLHILASGFFPALFPRTCDFQPRELGIERHARACVREPRRVTHGNKLATVLTTVQADICDGKLWTKEERATQREIEQKRRKGRPVSFRHLGRRMRLHVDVPRDYFIYELFHLSA